MSNKRFKFRGLALDVNVPVTELPPDHDPSDMPCRFCNCERVNWDYILDVTQMGYLTDHVITVVQCPLCHVMQAWDYYIEYARSKPLLTIDDLHD